MCQTPTGRLSTPAPRIAQPARAHPKPRNPSISSAATDSAPRPAEDRRGIGHQTLAAPVEVECPEACARVVAGAAAQERDAGAVAGHGEAARRAVCETGRDRLLAWERERCAVGAGDHRAADSR